MMTQPHSPEPWRVETRGGDDWYYSIVDALGKEVVQVAGGAAFDHPGTVSISEADAHRIVACVNACAGMSDDELKKRKA